LSGAHLCPIINTEDVTIEKIHRYIGESETQNSRNSLLPRALPQSKLLVVIPMAGAGSRFSRIGIQTPKPLIPIGESLKPMIKLVVDNINLDAHYIFITQRSHYEKYNIGCMLNLIAPGCDIVQVDGLTEGAACTVLAARHLIDNDSPVLFANSDQFLEWSSARFLYQSMNNVDGSIVTFTATDDPKWSFVRLDKDGFISEVAEKKPISDIATVGFYFWKKGSDFCHYADQMIEKNIRVNNEFYLAPVYNEAIIQGGKKFKIFPCDRMWGYDLKTF
jgi:dTDP-glucose pyrophosphorylase